MLPTVSPGHRANFNYTASRSRWCSASPGSGGWCPPADWFTGPKVQGSAEELAAIEAELEAI